jgi:tetratricopeptide (TPR) repeat protein
MAPVTETFAYTSTDYPDLFRHYVIHAVEDALALLQDEPEPVSPPIREQAWHTLSFALDLTAAWPAVRRLILALAPAMEQEGWWAEWAPFLERALDQSRQHNDRYAEAELSLRLGVAHRSLAHYAQARSWLCHSIERYGSLGDPINQARALNRLAFLGRLEGRLAEAEEHVTAALAQLPDDAITERATAYAILGAVACDRREWENATLYFTQTLVLRQQAPDLPMLAWAEADLALAYWGSGAYEQAIQAYERALALLARTQDAAQRAVIQMNLGAVYLSAQQPAQALSLFVACEATFHEVQDRRRLAMLYSNQGIALRELGHYDAARRAFDASLDLAERIGYIEMIINTLDELGLFYLAQGDPAAAARQWRQAQGRLHQLESEAVRTHYEQVLAEHLSKDLRAQRAVNTPE